MPTKISLALGPRQPLSRQVAWGCFTTNVTLPGFGTLLAGRITGYPQVILTLAGFALTTIFGIQAISWFLNNWTQFQQLQDQPDLYLREFWMHMRWALLGIALFALAWLWALVSSLAILAEARATEKRAVPPKIHPPS